MSYNLPSGCSQRDIDEHLFSDPIGDCPTCNGETNHGWDASDSDGRRWVWTSCDDCLAKKEEEENG